YNGLSSVLGKGFQLAQYEIFADDPEFINEDVKHILAVTTDDVMRVYNAYIKNQNYIATSFVPKGAANLALQDSKLAQVVEEKIVEDAEDTFDASIAATYEKRPSSFDRSVEPPYGESPDVKVPKVWKETLSSGLHLFGIENNEVPLVQFRIQIKGGMLLEDTNKIGVSNLLAEMLTKGTKNKTPQQLEDAIESLGATINANSTDESIVISGNTLAKNYNATMQLVTEILLEPRWDIKEFELLKQSTLSRIQRQKGNPNSIASNAYAKLIYGENHILSHNNMGTIASVNTITIEDLQNYYQSYISPTVTNFHVVGDISQQSVSHSLASLNTNWEARKVIFPEIATPTAPENSKVYFYDVSGAKQSVIRFGYPALSATDADYYKVQIMNYRLGGGGFASQLTQQLREGKGYTYGIRSGFSGTTNKGSFTISSSVRSNVTLESASLVKDIVSQYGKNYNENDLEITKGFMIKSNARAFETMRSKLRMLSNISNYNLPDDYAKQREAIVKNMTVADIKKLTEKYLNVNTMNYLVVGDAATQMEKLEALGFGKPILLNEVKKKANLE
ncbi:Protease, insulinase family, partial [hydrothermal vent metagenome]